jgi:inhibitor of KinA sporulation pathway (predicted exonuclease)
MLPLLRLPTIDTISDALSLWSNHFRGSQHKAIEQLMAQLLQTQAFDFADTQNKTSALIVVELLIYQFVEGLR